MKKNYFIIAAFFMAFNLHAALVVDNCGNSSPVNALGGTWQTFTDTYSSVTPPPAPRGAFFMTPGGNSGCAYCASMAFTLTAGAAYPFVGMITFTTPNYSPLGINLADYNGNDFYGIRFYAKCTGNGSYVCSLGTTQTSAVGNNYGAAFIPAVNWSLYEIPFSTLAQTWGTPEAWDPTTVSTIIWTATGNAGTTGQLYVDDVEFYLQSEAETTTTANVIISNPKVNQEGYLTGAKKYFYVVTQTASTNDSFSVVDTLGNTAYSGTISAAPVSDTASSGEYVLRGDFSPLEMTGRYCIYINGYQSCYFNIGDNVYDSLFKDALRCFYLVRCGTAINDPVTGLNHPICHAADATCKDTGLSRDFTGGWHNAGDVGKWSVEEALSVSYMMWLYELQTNNMKNLKNNIPESGNNISDLLNEARWGLNWLLKLQNSDGTVYHKVDTQPNFIFGTPPNEDPYTRYACYQSVTLTQIPSSIDAAVFVAACSQAARVFQGIDPTFANTCSQAAQKSYTWLEANRNIGQTDPYYIDPTTWQSVQWAEAEMFRLTGNSSISSQFNTDINTNPLSDLTWASPEFLGYFSLYQDSRTPAALKSQIQASIQTLCNSYLSTANSTGYGVVNTQYDYYWESNEDVLDKANCLLMGYLVTGTQAYEDAALNQLGYILGNNSLNHTFVTMHGTNYAQHPYNWIYEDYGILFPGWVSGGPDYYSAAGSSDLPLISLVNAGTPPAKCWLDLCSTSGSWASNEGETTDNAALVFLAGYFYSGAGNAGTGAAPASNLNNVIAFPSPCDLRKGQTGITFINLEGHTQLKIYNIAGELVYKVEQDTPNGTIFWNLTNQKSKTAPGIYVYFVSDKKGNTTKGKIAIIR